MNSFDDAPTPARGLASPPRDPGSDDTATVTLREIATEIGTKVAVGYVEDSTFIRFTDAAGEQTKLRISKEATEALIELIGGRKGYAAVSGAEIMWRLVQNVAARATQDGGR